MRWGTGALTEPDEAPPLPQAPVSRLGDTWACGAHRVRCGDATSAEDVAALLGSIRPLLMVTDAPYGVEYDPAWRVDTNMFKRGSESHGEVTNDDRVDWRAAWALFTGDVAYVWHASWYTALTQESLESSRFGIRASIIWIKQHFVFGRGDYHWQHEPCWYAVRKGAKGHWAGDRKQTTVWQIQNPNPMGGSRDDGQTGHSTQKPVECMRRPIANHDAREVYDPFLGSGTTMIAAEMEGRACLGMEIAPQYADCAVTRWANFTGKAATLEATGQTFAEVAAERAEKPKRKTRAAKAGRRASSSSQAHATS